MSLEEILKMLGSKHPLRENPIKEVIDGDEHMDYLTISGWKAYDRLTSLIFALDTLCPGTINIDSLIDELDYLVDNELY
jgi:hypothetical protein